MVTEACTQQPPAPPPAPGHQRSSTHRMSSQWGAHMLRDASTRAGRCSATFFRRYHKTRQQSTAVDRWRISWWNVKSENSWLLIDVATNLQLVNLDYKWQYWPWKALIMPSSSTDSWILSIEYLDVRLAAELRALVPARLNLFSSVSVKPGESPELQVLGCQCRCDVDHGDRPCEVSSSRQRKTFF